MTSGEITRFLAHRHWSVHRELIVPNVAGLLTHEADMCVLRKSGWMEEVEIKISKADFRREFSHKSFKHRILTEGIPKRLDPDYPIGDRRWREFYLGPEEKRRDWAACEPHIVSKFWFAMPLELAQELHPEIPTHAGLIAIYEKGHPEILKPAPRLKKSRKPTDAETIRLLKCAYHRYWKWAS